MNLCEHGGEGQPLGVDSSMKIVRLGHQSTVKL